MSVNTVHRPQDPNGAAAMAQDWLPGGCPQIEALVPGNREG
jgi:hypothetical protein